MPILSVYDKPISGVSDHVRAQQDGQGGGKRDQSFVVLSAVMGCARVCGGALCVWSCGCALPARLGNAMLLAAGWLGIWRQGGGRGRLGELRRV